MQYTGERLIPKLVGDQHGHLAMYMKSLESVDSNDVVLDIACGAGWGTDLLADKAKFVVGVDISAEAVAYAQKEYPRSNVRHSTGSILKIPFPVEFFDLILSIETFEHVHRSTIETLISECHRVLRMGGIWQFSTPDHNRHPYQPKSESEFRGYHFWHYTREELQALLSPFFTSIQIAIVHPSESLFATCRK